MEDSQDIDIEDYCGGEGIHTRRKLDFKNGVDLNNILEVVDDEVKLASADGLVDKMSMRKEVPEIGIDLNNVMEVEDDVVESALANAHDDSCNSRMQKEVNNLVEVDDDELPSADDIDDIGTVHSKMQKEQILEIGMKFETENDAWEFYNKYAFQVGFRVRKDKAYYSKDGKLKDRIFVCSAQGTRQPDKRDVNVKSHRPETRFGCLAKMKISCRRIQKFRVVEFVSGHNHVTSTPSKTQFHKSHRSMSVAQKAQADMAEGSGIAPKATLELLSRQAGGRQHLGFIPEDHRNYLRSKRTRQMRAGDTGGVLEYLQKSQLNDPNFLYAIQVDEDDLMTNNIWADARMRVDYAYFGDVVSFDTTYRKNKDGRPFAMFVGVNHHKQTVVFGAALLYDETAKTFEWLFVTFAEVMSGKRPQTIFTDQDQAMAKALASKWPDTCHRLCIWHIYQNAAKSLGHVFGKFKDFGKDFSSCIYDHDVEEDFFKAWYGMLDKYNLRENSWLNRLFCLREKWVFVYGRQNFCADITTTQRSESMNRTLKSYVSYKHDLLRFFEHFERLVDDRRYEELKADFKATQSSPTLAFPVKILRHAAKVYTPKVLCWFQKELYKAHDCSLKLFGETETISIYEVTPDKKNYHHIVTFDSADNSVGCSCKKYEFAGILC